MKIGSGVLAPDGRFDRAHHAELSRALLHARRDREVIVVSSGAIALGVSRLGWKSRPKELPKKQAAAAVGQSLLMAAWGEALAPVVVGQVLLTPDVLQDRRRWLHTRHTFSALLSAGAVPIVNENDTVAVDEIKFGDNDALAALVVEVAEADALIVLSDVDALYDGDPRTNPDARPLADVVQVTPALEAAAGGAGSSVGTGGMWTKVRAAKRCAELGVPCVVTSGKDAKNLARVLAAEPVGTFFHPTAAPVRGKKRWIAHATKVRGKVTVDEGAVRALVQGKKSLLASGVLTVQGAFKTGDAIELCGPDGVVFARGLARYDAPEARKIAGLRSDRIREVLGPGADAELVHRDELFVVRDG